MAAIPTTRLLARYALGSVSNTQLIDWACAMLGDGHDTPHLRFLGGRAESDRESEVRGDFEAALVELGLEVPPLITALDDHACFVCHQILAGTISVVEGHRALYEVWKTANYDARASDRRHDIWMYISDSLSTIEEGYGPLLAELSDLNEATYEAVFKREVDRFVRRYCKEQIQPPAPAAAGDDST